MNVFIQITDKHMFSMRGISIRCCKVWFFAKLPKPHNIFEIISALDDCVKKEITKANISQNYY